MQGRPRIPSHGIRRPRKSQGDNRVVCQSFCRLLFWRLQIAQSITLANKKVARKSPASLIESSWNSKPNQFFTGWMFGETPNFFKIWNLPIETTIKKTVWLFGVSGTYKVESCEKHPFLQWVTVGLFVCHDAIENKSFTWYTSHRIHMIGIFTYIWLEFMVHVSNYASPMDPMGRKNIHELRWQRFNLGTPNHGSHGKMVG